MENIANCINNGSSPVVTSVTNDTAINHSSNNVKQINPKFDELITPETIIKHINNIKNNPTVCNHDDILNSLLSQIKPVDFHLLAFPFISIYRDKLKKLTSLKIENILTFNLQFEIENYLNDNEDNKDEIIDIIKKINKCKIIQKHFLVLSIEQILLLAKKNHWNLSKNHDFIYIYNGSYWAELDKEILQKFLGDAAEKLGVVKFDARFFQFRDQLFKQFLSTAFLPIPKPKPDKVLINLANGTFEISPNATNLRNNNPDDFLTYQLPFNFDASADCPIFMKYLNRVLPDIQSQNLLSEFIGYVFIKHTSKTLKEEKALILYGSGANGKSVFFEVISALFGNQNVSNYSLQSLTEEKGFYRAKIANKLLNYCSEISVKLEVSFFKSLVSGEPVEACLKYGQPFNMTDYAKFIFNCNELPRDIEHSNAFFRRFIIIPFSVTIPDNEQDKTLSYKIIDNELSGVFNWVLNGLNRLISQKGFSNCDAADIALSQYKKESNSVYMFIEENNYQKSSNQFKLIKELYIEYRTFCIDDGYNPFKKTNFMKQLKSLGCIIERQSGTGQNIVFLNKQSEIF